MSDSEDEDHAYYGTPLEPLDEENLPSKKPILIQDQIATDKHGKRRFHGAFTGGFSAGFFNTVGTLEGWAPSNFKSSRSSKADTVSQRPEDFMDDEDTDDFGIAPTQLRAKPEYSGSKTTKRKHEISDGPIPGDPVLKNFLEPASITVGMKLLMGLGWKPGQGIGPMLTWAEKMGDEVDPEELGLKPDVLFPPTPVQEHFIKAKSDKFGLGYVGLSKEPVLKQRFTLFDEPLKVNDNKKKLSIRGQAFGVGAFEDEDEDIYAKDDMSRYDFALETSASLREAKRQERLKEKAQLAIREAFNCIEGFEPSKNTSRKKLYFPPPELPADFDPNELKRKSRFGPEVNEAPSVVKGKHIITSADRAAILGETTKKIEEKSDSVSESNNSAEQENLSVADSNDGSFRPFITDPPKQQRYERYLGFIKIGAKDALKNIQPIEMSAWEREREATEFEQAAKLYRPLSGLMNDRFSRGGMLDDSANALTPFTKPESLEVESWVKAAKEKKFGKLTRFISDWDPVPILCKRMNIPEPRNSDVALASIAEEANRRKPKFSAFDFLDTAKNAGITSIEEEKPPSPEKSERVEASSIVSHESERENILLPKPLLDSKIVENEDPKEKMDLFKAIFASSDEESDSEDPGKKNSPEERVLEMDKVQTNSQNKNVLRNTSPPRGIFANLDLDALKPKPLPSKEKTDLSNNKDTKKPEAENETEQIDPSMLYGPSLPSKPVYIPQSKTYKESESSSSSEDEWVEKGKDKTKKKKHSKKHKKEKKKDRNKHKKKKKR